MSNHHKFEKSASLQHCDYDDNKGHMIICFASGGTYRYECPKSVYEELKAAKSAGSHFHAHIKKNYAGVKI